jgi:hypothetical protein
MSELNYIRDAILNGERRFRIEEIEGGFEPQMLYTCGVTEAVRWFPLNAAGCWAEPDAYSFGVTKRRHPLKTREEAERAVVCARRIEGQQLVRVVGGLDSPASTSY